MRKDTRTVGAKTLEQYEHTDKERANNSPAGLVTTEPEELPKKYVYDPHIDPARERHEASPTQSCQ
jgi:hypothetical protein